MPKKNGFVMYIETRRSEFETKGRRLSMRDLIGLCAKGWEELPEEERKKFVQSAKAYNEPMKRREPEPIPIPIVTTTTKKKEPIGATRESEALHTLLQDNRDILIRMFEEKKDAWVGQPIVICSFSLYVEPESGNLYLPAEMGLTAMTVNDGVVDNYCRIIEPGSVPLGYGIEAKQTAKLLGLPELGTTPELGDYEPLIMNLESFLQKYRGNFPREDLYVFAFDSDFGLVTRCLEWMFKTTKWQLPVKVLSLDLYGFLASSNSDSGRFFTSKGLTPQLSLLADPPSAPISSYRKPGQSLTGSFVYASNCPTSAYGIFVEEAEVGMTIRDVDNFKYYEELCCVYHFKSGEESHKCALAVSNRYAFGLLEILTISNEVKIIPGRHFPEVDKQRTEKNRRYRMLAMWGLTQLESEMEDYAEDQDRLEGHASVAFSSRRRRPRRGDLVGRRDGGQEKEGGGEAGGLVDRPRPPTVYRQSKHRRQEERQTGVGATGESWQFSSKDEPGVSRSFDGTYPVYSSGASAAGPSSSAK